MSGRRPSSRRPYFESNPRQAHRYDGGTFGRRGSRWEPARIGAHAPVPDGIDNWVFSRLRLAIPIVQRIKSHLSVLIDEDNGFADIDHELPRNRAALRERVHRRQFPHQAVGAYENRNRLSPRQLNYFYRGIQATYESLVTLNAGERRSRAAPLIRGQRRTRTGFLRFSERQLSGIFDTFYQYQLDDTTYHRPIMTAADKLVLDRALVYLNRLMRTRSHRPLAPTGVQVIDDQINSYV